jgi:hypothetical protein
MTYADIPAAGYANGSATVIPMQRMRGPPLRVPGAIVIQKVSDVNNIARAGRGQRLLHGARWHLDLRQGRHTFGGD